MDTIYALASARGKAGVAVVRISGPRALAAAGMLAGSLPEPRRAGLRRLVWRGEAIDEALVIVFPSGGSFTGEDVVELHLHGSVATVQAALAALGGIEGLRTAAPGEFTRRALENGRLDLAQVEGLADLIEAETEAQRRQALRVLSGAVGERAARWRRDLVRAVALVEATIDFADEDVPVDVGPEVVALISAVAADLSREIAGGAAAERVRDGFEVAILGRPNAGKSTLLNTLAGREAAITSARAGTTRDVIEVRMDLAGLAVTLLDTAGLRETEDEVEAAGIARARARAQDADLRVILTDAAGMPEGVEVRPGDIVLRGRCDVNPGPGPGVSGRTGEGVGALIARIAAELGDRAPTAAVFVRARHLEAARRAGEALAAARDRIEAGGQAELVSEEIRSAIRALDMLVGRVGVEDYLDVIFASFCIGK